MSGALGQGKARTFDDKFHGRGQPFSVTRGSQLAAKRRSDRSIQLLPKDRDSSSHNSEKADVAQDSISSRQTARENASFEAKFIVASLKGEKKLELKCTDLLTRLINESICACV